MIRWGVAGWDYEAWKGRVYPARPPARFDPLRYATTYFQIIEINRTYYRPATPKDAQSSLSRICDRPTMVFSAKLPERFVAPGKSWSHGDVLEARAGLDRLVEHDRLIASVLQFAFSFKRTLKDGTVNAENAAWLRRGLEAFRGLPLFVEFRHDSWNKPPVLDELRARGVGWVNIDQPLLFKQSLPLTTHATTSVGYLRMHGRNYQTWGRGIGRKSKTAENVEARRQMRRSNKAEPQKHDRFDYLYSAAEVHELAGATRKLASAAGVRDVVTVNNNHMNGKGAVNALMLDSVLRRELVPAPPDLFREFGEVLHDFAYPAAAAPEQEELELFPGHAR